MKCTNLKCFICKLLQMLIPLSPKPLSRHRTLISPKNSLMPIPRQSSPQFPSVKATTVNFFPPYISFADNL